MENGVGIACKLSDDVFLTLCYLRPLIYGTVGRKHYVHHINIGKYIKIINFEIVTVTYPIFLIVASY